MTYTPPPDSPYSPPAQPQPPGYPQPNMQYPGYAGYPAQPKHSGLGVASFIISLLVGLGEFVMVIVAGVMATRAGGMDEKSPGAIMLGLLLLGGLALAVIGAALGIASLMQRDRKKLFGILGIVFNGLIVLLVVGLMVVGIMAK